MATPKDPGLFIFQEDKPVQKINPSHPSKPADVLAASNQKDTVYTPTTLYEYSLGLRDIQARHIQYGERQAFVSKPFTVPGNVMEVELDATEEHPFFDEVSGQANPRQTSVEYSISYKSKPSQSDWVPILPKDQKQVQGERLFFSGNRADLRFPAKMDTIQVYANGLRLKPSEFTLLSNESLSIVNHLNGSIYTVDYEPDSYQTNPWTFQVENYKDDIETITETFPEGTAFNKTISLRHYPYIDMAQVLTENPYNPNTSVYKPLQVRLTNASIQGKSQTILKQINPYREEAETAFTYNRTLYKDNSWTPLRAYSLNPENPYQGFDYYHWKNKLTFTEHFNAVQRPENLPYTHGTGTIEVTYQTLVTNFRLKIILRRNTASELTATPKVNNYRMRFKTKK